MPPYTIEKTLKRHKLSQAVVPMSRTHRGIVGSRFYHFPPAHNRPNVPVSFKRTRITRHPQKGEYYIQMCLRYSTWLDWKVIAWEHQYVKLNNALSTAIVRFRYLRSRIREASNGRKNYLISCLLQHKVIPQPLGNSGRLQKTTERKATQINRSVSSSHPTSQISMPVSANITPSEIQRVVDVNQIKCIHFGRVEIFPSTGLLISLVKFKPFTTMSEVKVNQWDELSQFIFREKSFTNPIATNGALLEGFMFVIGWCK
ncbi:hypothetical protein O181_105484 [Austropuccinia psidii MF-1]|uniref:Uncharacterized protein n=1 Tax=Austropuccinia psidii MF-1 TaxID=1389203 RepID=A0A9Q3JPH3_9BASI|nr:hypothetical protein [Austropuccinia psidii MF-1]